MKTVSPILMCVYNKFCSVDEVYATLAVGVKAESKGKTRQQTKQKPKTKEELSQEEAAIIIQSQFRGYQARKEIGPLYGKMDDSTKLFMKQFCKKWKKSSIFHVLLLYRAAKYQDLIYFSQQAHLYNQNAVSALLNNHKDEVSLKNVDQRAKASQFLGEFKPAVWKLPFRIKEFPFCETHLDPSTRVSLADDVSWDDPFKYQPSTDHYGYVMKGNEKKKIYVREEDNNDVINFIQTPYCRDPNIAESMYEGQPYRKYDTNKKVQRKSMKNRRAPTPQEFPVNTGVNVKQQISNLKGVNPAKTFNPQANNYTGVNKNVQERNNDYSANNNSRSNYHGPKRDHNPIIEMEKRGCKNEGNEDDPPFNFQAMLRKTNVTRASLRRSPEPNENSNDYQQNRQGGSNGNSTRNNNYGENVVYNSGYNSSNAHVKQKSYNDDRVKSKGYNLNEDPPPVTRGVSGFRNTNTEEPRNKNTVETELIPGFVVQGQISEL